MGAVRWVLPTLLLFCVQGTALLAGPTPPTRTAAQLPDPDRLYADREHLPSARQAAAIWEARLGIAPGDFDAAWKLARACYWLGGHVVVEERRRQYERGIEAGRRAAEIDGARPEGHFWMAAAMGAMAESFGLRAGVRYRSPVKRALETVLSIAPAYQEGSADRALGRWYLKVPGFLGGSRSQAVAHLRRSLTYDPTNAASHFFLFETYLAMGRKDDARESLRRVLDAPEPPEWGPEVREFKQRARMELARIR